MQRTRSRRVLVLAAWGALLLGCLGIGEVASAGSIDLREVAPAVTGIPDATNFDAFSVASAGDVNGDGVPDVIVGSGNDSPLGRSSAGSAFVVFGRSPFAPVSLAEPTFNGFVIQGAGTSYDPHRHDEPENDLTGWRVAGVGDVNGDGLADVALAAPFASNSRRGFSGSVYVVFGRRTTTPVDLRRLGAEGYRIDGPAAGSTLGVSLARAGDVNGDGVPDLIAGASFLYGRRGSAWVVLGRQQPGTVDLRRPAGQAYLITGGRRVFSAGVSVAGIGDFNADGIPDVAVGAPIEHETRNGTAGAAFVVFGQHSNQTIDLSRLGGHGLRFDGAPRESLGNSVAAAGDFNGDGVPDALIGAAGAPFGVNHAWPGSAYVVFGGPSAVSGRLDRLGSRRLRIRGAGPADGTGASADTLGDINADGHADIAIGAPSADVRCRQHAGAVYVVYGRAGGGTLALNQLAARGYRIDGAQPVDNAGAGIAAVQSPTGSAPDLLIAAPWLQPGGTPDNAPPPTWNAFLVPTQSTAPGDTATFHGRCIKTEVIPTTRARILRTGRIDVRVTVANVSPRTILNVVVAQLRPRRDAIYVAYASTFNQPPTTEATTLMTATLTPAGRRLLRSGRRLSLRVTATQLTDASGGCCEDTIVSSHRLVLP
jgi:hypothetical protein